MSEMRVLPFLGYELEKAPVIVNQVMAPEQPAQMVRPEPPQEQIQAADTYFAREQESNKTANFLGLWTSSMMLADLARDHLPRSAEKEHELDPDSDDVEPPGSDE